MYSLLITLALASYPQEWRVAVCDKNNNCITSLEHYYISRAECEKGRKAYHYKDRTQCAQIIR